LEFIDNFLGLKVLNKEAVADRSLDVLIF